MSWAISGDLPELLEHLPIRTDPRHPANVRRHPGQLPTKRCGVLRDVASRAGQSRGRCPRSPGPGSRSARRSRGVPAQCAPARAARRCAPRPRAPRPPRPGPTASRSSASPRHARPPPGPGAAPRSGRRAIALRRGGRRRQRRAARGRSGDRRGAQRPGRPLDVVQDPIGRGRQAHPEPFPELRLEEPQLSRIGVHVDHRGNPALVEGLLSHRASRASHLSRWFRKVRRTPPFGGRPRTGSDQAPGIAGSERWPGA